MLATDNIYSFNKYLSYHVLRYIYCARCWELNKVKNIPSIKKLIIYKQRQTSEQE